MEAGRHLEAFYTYLSWQGQGSWAQLRVSAKTCPCSNCGQKLKRSAGSHSEGVLIMSPRFPHPPLLSYLTVNCFVVLWPKTFYNRSQFIRASVFFVIYGCGGHILCLADLLVLGRHFCTWTVGNLLFESGNSFSYISHLCVSWGFPHVATY